MNIAIDNYNIFYKDEGKGKVVVILQGWGTNLNVYESIANYLKDKYRVIRLDLPGFGSSDEPREPWSVERYVEFFLEFLSKLELHDIILIGHSYGGRMIIRLASRESLPLKISKIILVDSAGVLPKKTAIKKLKIIKYKCLKKIINLNIVNVLFHNHIERWKRKQGSKDYRDATPIMRQCLVKAVNEDLTSLLKKISVETLLIWGENDNATPISDAYLMEKEIPNAGLAVIKNAGHYCFLDQPLVFERIIKSYL